MAGAPVATRAPKRAISCGWVMPRWLSSFEPLQLLDLSDACSERSPILSRRYPHAHIWSVIEHDDLSNSRAAAACHERGHSIVTGNITANNSIGRLWAQEAGGGFDVIIDPTVSSSSHPILRLLACWNIALRPGGRFIFEDVASDLRVVGAMQDYMEWLIIRATTCQWKRGNICWRRNFGKQRPTAMQEVVHDPPPELLYIVVLKQSLVLRKAAGVYYSPSIESFWSGTRSRHEAITLPHSLAPEDACISNFTATANRSERVTDKINPHYYHVLYGSQLCHVHGGGRVGASAPGLQGGRGGRQLWTSPAKMLEIGLGCNMAYGPGASARLWEALFRSTERWEAEYNGECVKATQAKGLLDGVHLLIGDQGNRETVAQWVQQSGGHFDVVIDDGGHGNRQILTSFERLWPELSPGGIYFIEDMQLGRTLTCDDTNGSAVVADFVQSLAADVLVGRKQAAKLPDEPKAFPRGISVPGGRRRSTSKLFSFLPADLFVEVEYVFCTLEACSVGKAPVGPSRRSAPVIGGGGKEGENALRDRARKPLQPLDAAAPAGGAWAGGAEAGGAGAGAGGLAGSIGSG